MQSRIHIPAGMDITITIKTPTYVIKTGYSPNEDDPIKVVLLGSPTSGKSIFLDNLLTEDLEADVLNNTYQKKFGDRAEYVSSHKLRFLIFDSDTSDLVRFNCHASNYYYQASLILIFDRPNEWVAHFLNTTKITLSTEKDYFLSSLAANKCYIYPIGFGAKSPGIICKRATSLEQVFTREKNKMSCKDAKQWGDHALEHLKPDYQFSYEKPRVGM